MEYRITAASSDDFGEIVAWRMEAIEAVFGEADEEMLTQLRAENERYLSEALAAESFLMCFAENDEGKRIGCGGTVFHEELPSPDFPHGRSAFIMNIYVRSEARHQGAGSAIITWLIDAAHDRGCEKIYLESTIEAAPLYHKMGFHDALGYMLYEG